MPRNDLPGFYFDSEKNRYFPLAHQKRAREEKPPEKKDEEESKEGGRCKAGLACVGKVNSSAEDGVLQLIHRREISGNRRYGPPSNNVKPFQGQYLEVHTFQPRVWKYSKTSNWADGGLEQLRVSLQTLEGEVEEDVMALGGTNGHLGIWQVTEHVDEDFQPPIFPADHCLPTNPNLWTGEEKEAPVVWPSMKTVVFPSKITSIQRLNEWSDADRLENGKRLQQNVIITTLGSGVNGGSLYLLCPTHGYLSNPLQQHMCALPFRLSTVVTTNQSIWTSESNPRGKSASLGMSSGAAIVDLEKCETSWLCRGSSDVLSQQFDSSGNILLCGFRNGVISTIDLRLPPPRAYPPHSSDPSSSGRVCNASKKFQGRHRRSEHSKMFPNLKRSYEQMNQHAKGQRNSIVVDDLYCSHSKIMQMKSAICSMVLLRSSEWYLLAGAMNGDLQQWDRRFVGKGAVRSYEEHCNSHTMLQLGIDPSERLLIAGGEDCAVRVWSLSSGRLLHVEKGLTTPAATVSFRTSFRMSDSSQWGGYSQEAPFEEDNAWSMWMGSSSGLLHMRGAAR